MANFFNFNNKTIFKSSDSVFNWNPNDIFLCVPSTHPYLLLPPKQQEEFSFFSTKQNWLKLVRAWMKILLKFKNFPEICVIINKVFRVEYSCDQKFFHIEYFSSFVRKFSFILLWRKIFNNDFLKQKVCLLARQSISKLFLRGLNSVFSLKEFNFKVFFHEKLWLLNIPRFLIHSFVSLHGEAS